MEKLIMNRKEREQAKIFEQVKQGILKLTEAAARLRITGKWAGIKMKRYLEDGDKGLIHKSRGKPSQRRWDPQEKKLMVELLKEEWHEFGPTFTVEKLDEIYSIKISKESARTVMINEGLWQPKKQRVKHRKRRERKPMLGMMVQLDGSPHDWFEGRARSCTLLVFIDDATSQILWLEFAESESVIALMQATQNYIKKHGIPQSFYNDHGSVFHVNLHNAEDEKKTQWERAVAQLDIEVLHANSPQAKGRVERSNGTLQDRLIKEMRLAGISSIDAANEFIQTSNFLEKHNQKFAVKASQEGNAHRSSESFDLYTIFSIQETRILTNDFTITYNKQIYQLHKEQRTIIRPKNEIVVKTHLNGSISLWIRQTKLFFNKIQHRPQSLKEKQVPCYKSNKPNINSRRWVAGLFPLSNRESRVKPALAAVEPL